MTGVIAVLASVAAFLAAAKSHGRQVRLERELAGYWEWTIWLPAVVWAPIVAFVAFVALGVASLRRFGAALRRGTPPGRATDAAWLRRALAGSAAWWLVTFGLIAAAGWAAWP